VRFVEARLPRNIRSLQRYCAAGRLDCITEETASGLAYFVDPESVERVITQLAQLHGITDEVRHGAPVHEMPHQTISRESSTTPRARRDSGFLSSPNMVVRRPGARTRELVRALERAG
jgi:hypothetical protein